MSEETLENRLKRMQMRSWRRGIKEMDFVLGAFADHELAKLSRADLDVYDRLLEENDHDLYGWICGRSVPPDQFAPLLQKIAQAVGMER
jgi:antitoxin CptB